jgi:polyketide cyclase/dehydrase/lipid transport protein
MPRPYASGIVPASADAVWQVVRQFNGLADWHPIISESKIESGSAQEVGAVRRLTLADGSQVAEKLLILDDDDRSYTYAFTDPGAMPVRSYRSTVRIAPITTTGQAFVEWWAWFDSEAGVEEQMSQTFSEAVYGAGIAALVEHFSK